MLTNILFIAVSILIGFFVGVLLHRLKIKNRLNSSKEQAKAIKSQALKDAEVIKKEAKVRAKEKWYDKKSDLEEEISSRKKELHKLENKYNSRINNLETRLSKVARREQSVNDREQNLEKKLKSLQSKEDKLKHLIEEEKSKLKKIAGLTKKQAIERLLASYEEEAKSDGAKLRKRILSETEENAEEKARKILATAVQRTAVDYVADSTVSVVPLPSDDMKGRIIGREGRNIRSFEKLTGIEIIVDDTPEAVVLSGFHPVRREIAKRALEALIKDGRIHPGRIEDTIKKARKEIDKIITETGKKTCLDLALHNIPGKIKNLIGRLKFRTSYGQNVLQHSIETGWISGIIASELNLDQALARKIGLLHDIGKAIDYEQDGTHPEIGARYAKRNKMPDVIVNAIAAHHEDVEPESTYAVIVQAADAVSGARPGARRETLESYLQRLEDLEEIASSFDGVHNSYAIQAGREIRIMVKNGEIDDSDADLLASDVAKKIEENLQYPGQITVTVIREVRKNALAK